MKFDICDISIEKLIIDPNNYRFLDLSQWTRRQKNRYHNQPVQDATIKLLESVARYNLNELRKSFLANGYVRFERIVVTPYNCAEGYFLVVEGNRRIAAIKTLLRDNNEGVITLTEEQVKDFSIIPVAILDPEEQGLIAAERVIMGIRHIAGPQEWGAYQQAYLILQLVDEEGKDFDEIARHLNLSAMDTRRRYRAIRALKAMQNDEMYSKAAKPEYYRLFNELISLPKVREFFSWDNETATFNDEDSARQFFELIEPLESDISAKLKTYIDVRKLRGIIGNSNAEAELLDPEQPLSVAIAKSQPELGVQEAPDLINEAKRFNKVLNEAQIEALTSISEEDIRFLEELISLISSRIEQYQKLVS